MRIRLWCLFMAVAALGGTSSVSAGEFGSGSHGIRRPVAGFHRHAMGGLRHAVGPRHRFHRFGRVPLYLEQDYHSPVVVVVQESAVSPALDVDLAPVPSVANLPTVMGIREVLPDRAQIQVLNEPVGARALPSGGAQVIAVPASEEPSSAGPGASAGARIVHLTVPVGTR
ncbi:hypothetical protein [Microvirga massiliensis]|uniref:hypothetical protein n=1 Tax=Microvirga massiliensis TaxID=1033741 RepID=UPI00062B4905|nr:hypothetical protein [Microvirga massiliensis]